MEQVRAGGKLLEQRRMWRLGERLRAVVTCGIGRRGEHLHAGLKAWRLGEHLRAVVTLFNLCKSSQVKSGQVKSPCSIFAHSSANDEAAKHFVRVSIS